MPLERDEHVSQQLIEMISPALQRQQPYATLAEAAPSAPTVAVEDVASVK